MKKYFLWLFSIALSFNILFVYSSQNSVTANTVYDKSLQYLVDNYASASKSDKDWAAIALGVFNQGVAVTETSSSSILSLSRVALAKNAQGLSAKNEVGSIISYYNNSYFGSEGLINDDIFAVLAIATYNKQWLNDNPKVFSEIAISQKPNGSFSHSKSSAGDTDMTAAAIWALSLSSTYTSEKSKAVSYISSAQNTDGGFGYKVGVPSNIASTSWAIIGLRTTNNDVSVAENYLDNAMGQDGAWHLNNNPSYRSTSYALMALSGKRIPLKQNTVSIPSNNTTPIKETVDNPRKLPKDSSGNLSNNPATPQQPTVRELICTATASSSASASASNGKTEATSEAKIETICR